MLGSVHDADDALQDASLRAWRGLARFEGRSSLRSWLYTIATNTCLTQIERRPKRVLPVEYGPADRSAHGPGRADDRDASGSSRTRTPTRGRPAGPEGYEQRESVELAFIAALQHLPATQRAVLILREVLGFSAKEAADDARDHGRSVNSALQRARATIEERAAGAEPAGDAAGARRRAARARSSTPTSTRGSAATSTRSSNCSPRTRRSRCRRWQAGSARATRSGTFLAQLSDVTADGRGEAITTTANGQPAFGA